MILFLDTVSSLPEFSLIKDNKIIYSEKILLNLNDKMSDMLIPSFIKLQKKYKLESKLHLLLINTGPGSYTALRIGIAFFSGLSLSQNINLTGISCPDLLRFAIPEEELQYSVIYISSSNDQNFIGFYNIYKKNFEIKKIEYNNSFDMQGFDLSLIKKIYTHEALQEKNKFFFGKEIKIISFAKLVSNNITLIENYKKNKIIEPIYYSNNKILN